MTPASAAGVMLSVGEVVRESGPVPYRCDALRFCPYALPGSTPFPRPVASQERRGSCYPLRPRRFRISGVHTPGVTVETPRTTVNQWQGHQATIAHGRGYCSWTVDHASWVVTLHSPDTVSNRSVSMIAHLTLGPTRLTHRSRSPLHR
jgi:hypothetical protein